MYGVTKNEITPKTITATESHMKVVFLINKEINKMTVAVIKAIPCSLTWFFIYVPSNTCYLLSLLTRKSLCFLTNI